ncbi:MAG: methyl-accepting chemotaxis protein, partial [Clostridia bacterium]|nr:methyl-accepting chemotaxis protein [Clostridia bacterium]
MRFSGKAKTPAKKERKPRGKIQIKMSVRLISGFVLVSLFVLAIGALGLNNMSKMNSNATQIYNVNLQSLVELQEFYNNTLNIRFEVTNLVDLKVSADVKSSSGRIKELRTLNDGYLKAYEATELSTEKKQIVKKLKSDLLIYRMTVDKAVTLMEDGNYEQAAVQGKIINGATDELKESIDKLIEMETADAKAANDNNQALFQNSSRIMTAILGVAVALALFLGFFISASITRRLKKVVIFAEKLGQGDLTHTINIKSRDEIGSLAASLNKSVENIKNLIGEVVTSTSDLSATSEEISATVEEL